jgi:hypothetical protein
MTPQISAAITVHAIRRTPVCRHAVALAMLLVASASPAMAQEPRSPFVHAAPAPSPIVAAWAHGPDPKAVIRTSAPRLALELRNLRADPAVADVHVRIARNGGTVGRRQAIGALAGLERRQVQLAFTPDELGLEALELSGAIHVTVAVTDVRGRPLPHADVSTVYYHRDAVGLLFYGRQALVDQFSAGDLRDSHPAWEALSMVRSALRDGGLPFEPKLARVSNAVTTFGGNSSAADGRKRFCLGISSNAFYDSSGRPWRSTLGVEQSEDYGEDYGIDGSLLPMARAFAIVSQEGNRLWHGHLDQAGCTPPIAAASDLSTSLYYSTYYSTKHSGLGVNLQMFTTDVTIDAAVPVPLFHMEVAATASPLVVTWLDEDEYVHSIFAAAAACLERYPGGHTAATYEFRLEAKGDNTGTHTDYSTFGWPVVHVKHSTTARSKFTLAHEYGHAILMAPLSPPLTAADIDYSVEAGEESQHAWGSKEWQFAAALEGFAHFVSAAVWNDVHADADGVVVTGSNINPFYQGIFDMNTFDRVFEITYEPAHQPDQGVEDDWAQFFWNYRTDTQAAAGTPDSAQLVQMWLLTYPWPKHAGFFAHLAAGVTLAIPLPGGGSAQPRFATFATLAGVDH